MSTEIGYPIDNTTCPPYCFPKSPNLPVQAREVYDWDVVQCRDSGVKDLPGKTMQPVAARTRILYTSVLNV